MVAEEIFFGESSTGVAGDLQAATQSACQMIGLLGMGTTLISSAALEYPAGGVVSKVLATDDGRAEVEGLLSTAKASVTGMLGEHRHVVEALRDALLDRHELIGDEILEVIRSAGPALAVPALVPALAVAVAVAVPAGQAGQTGQPRPLEGGALAESGINPANFD
jgi:ATP-dependent Zn protease